MVTRTVELFSVVTGAAGEDQEVEAQARRNDQVRLFVVGLLCSAGVEGRPIFHQGQSHRRYLRVTLEISAADQSELFDDRTTLGIPQTPPSDQHLPDLLIVARRVLRSFIEMKEVRFGELIEQIPTSLLNNSDLDLLKALGRLPRSTATIMRDGRDFTLSASSLGRLRQIDDRIEFDALVDAAGKAQAHLTGVTTYGAPSHYEIGRTLKLLLPKRDDGHAIARFLFERALDRKRAYLCAHPMVGLDASCVQRLVLISLRTPTSNGNS